MEMPEGWNKLRERPAQYLCEIEDYVFLSPSDRETIVVLMKEMAEAMESVAEHFGEASKLTINGTDYRFSPIVPILDALKKFKEWK